MSEIAAYSYDESGDVVVDYSGNGHDFSIAGSDTVRVSAGHTNGGASCDNTGSLATLPLIGLTPQRTVMCWLLNPPDGAWPIMWRYAPLDSGAWGIVRLAGDIAVRARNQAGDPPQQAAVPWPADGQPHHVLGSYDGTSLRLFLDGALVATTPYAGPLRTDTNAPTLHVAWGNVAATAYQDDLRILDDAVVNEAVATAYMNTPVGAAAVPHEVTATIDLTVDMAATTAAEHAVTTAVPLEVDIDAATANAHEVTAEIGLEFDVSASAATTHEVSAPIDLTIDVGAVTASEDHTVTAEIPLTLAVTARSGEPPPVDDPIGWPYAERLQSCLCSLLVAEDPVGCCCVQPGANVPWDDCQRGQGWVRVANQYATDVFPQPASRPSPCGGTAGWAVVLELAVLRCMPQPDQHGRLPSCDTISSVARRVQADKHRMLRALMCCDWRRPPNSPDGTDEPEMVVGPWVPLSQGDCTGGMMTVTVHSEQCVCTG